MSENYDISNKKQEGFSQITEKIASRVSLYKLIVMFFLKYVSPIGDIVQQNTVSQRYNNTF